MTYKSYLKSATTPNRKLRKSQRSITFQYNRKLSKLAKRPRGTVRP